MKPFPELRAGETLLEYTDRFGTLRSKKVTLFLLSLRGKERKREVILCVSGPSGVRNGPGQGSLKIEAQKGIQKSKCILFVQKKGRLPPRKSVLILLNMLHAPG